MREESPDERAPHLHPGRGPGRGHRLPLLRLGRPDERPAPLPPPLNRPAQRPAALATVPGSARIAQLVEHFHGKEGVAGSSPAPGSFILVADRTPRSRGRGRTRPWHCSRPARCSPPSPSRRGLRDPRPHHRLLGRRRVPEPATPSQRNLWLNRTVDAGAGIVRLGVEWPAIAPTRPPDPTNPDSVLIRLLPDRPGRSPTPRPTASRSCSASTTPRPGRRAPAVPHQPQPGPGSPTPPTSPTSRRRSPARYSGSPRRPPRGPGDRGLGRAQQRRLAHSPVHRQDLHRRGRLPRHAQRRLRSRSSRSTPRSRWSSAARTRTATPPAAPTRRAAPAPARSSSGSRSSASSPAKTKKKKGKKPAPIKYVRTAGCNGPVNFDVFAHHPIDNTGGGPLQVRTQPLRRLDARPRPRRERPPRRREGRHRRNATKHPVWVTEFWWDSKPPNPVGAKLATQARWIEQSMYLFWKAGASRGDQLPDRRRDSTAPTSTPGSSPASTSTTAGPKPSLTAFSFPFVTDRINTKTLFSLGQGRPRAASSSSSASRAPAG